MRSRNFTSATSVFLCAVALSACRGNPSEDPPIHWQRNMFTQDKAKPQRETSFFEDGRMMRPLVEGTLSQSAPVIQTPYYTGLDEQNRPVTKFPEQVAVDETLLKTGQERFNIFCSPCHDRTGQGNGLVIQRANQRAAWSIPSYSEQRLLDTPVGDIFSTITNGKGTMRSYAYQVPVADRWAIVAYVRALQRSQGIKVEQLTAEQRSQLK
ncbi:MAG TPA: cytochrome c [Pseudomonadota bacterium]|mgnify:CR=1 FL=1|nr:cytochrome c [Pseudomonadota bacterium]